MPDEPDAPDDDTDDEKPPEKPKETDWKAEARKWQDRARANNSAAKELDELKKKGMTDFERQVDEAKKATRAETLAEVGQSRAEDAIRFSIGDRLPAADLDELLDNLNLAKFLTEDGKVDREKVANYVGRVAPAKSGREFPDLGQGARSGARPGAGSFLADAIRNRHS